MPLDAKVVSLEQLLLKYPCLDVPNYQRTFKWTEEKITNTFQDILNGLDFTSKADGRGHFLGSIVVCNDHLNNKVDLVDGQQRLTTLTIMLCSLAKLADKKTLKNAKKTILQEDQLTPRLLHKEKHREISSDREAYLEIIKCLDSDGTTSDEITIPEDPDQQSILAKTPIYKAGTCLDDLAKRACEAYMRDVTSASREEAATKIYECLAKGIKLIIIETDQRKEGMRVFASINAGGTKLEPWELIMSSFYTHGPEPKQQDLVQLTFENDKHSISKVLAEDNNDSAINNGLRTFWLATRRFTRMDDLFNEFNELLSKSSDPKRTHSDLLKQILFCVPILKAFDTAPNTVQCLTPKYEFELSCIYPLTVAMKDKLARPILLSILLLLREDPDSANDALRRVAFALEMARMKLIICKYKANFIEKPYSQLAVEIYKGKYTQDPEKIEEAVYNFLRNIKGFPVKEEFELGFKRYNPFGQDQKLTKIIAIRLQDAIRNSQQLSFLYRNTPKENITKCKLLKGLNFPDNCTRREITNLGFMSLANLETIGNSIGNLFIATSDTDTIDDSIEFNGKIEIEALDEKAMTERRDYLAELAVQIWNF